MSSVMTRVLLAMIHLCTLLSCYSAPPHGPSVRAIDIQLVEVDKGDPTLFASLLQHPHRFSTPELAEILASLHFSPQGIIGWDPPRQVFPDPTITRIVPMIQATFEEASALQKLVFSVPSSPGNTTGDLFVMQGKLHMRVEVLNGKPHYDAYPSPFTYESETAIEPHWILRTREGQTYGDHESFLGMRQDMKSWVAVELGMTGTTGSEKPPAASPTSFSERLGKIRDLRDSGLISEAEYREKADQLSNEAEASGVSPYDHLHFLTSLHEHGLLSDEELAYKRAAILESL